MPPIADIVTDPDNILSAFVAAVCFATIVTLAMPVMQGDKLAKRMKDVSAAREQMRRKSRAAMAKEGQGVSLRMKDEGFYKRVVEKLNLKTLLEDPTVADKLAQAGFRGPRPIAAFYFFRFAGPFVLAAIAAAYIYLIADLGLQSVQKVCVVVAAFAVGFYAPNVYLSNTAQKRQKSIAQAFPDALDLLLICVESGMSIEAALQKVSQEIGGASLELAEELSLLVAELNYLPERRMAYENLARRCNHPGVKSVCTAMVQAEKYGTPLGQALRVMAKENRELRMTAAEKKAAQLPAQLTVPMIVFFLPVLFIVIMTPAIIRVMDNFGAG
jgi:tight adherence protein C